MPEFESTKVLLHQLYAQDPEEYRQFLMDLADRYGVEALFDALGDLLGLDAMTLQ